MPVEKSLSELISISRAFGSDIRFVWAGGGNVSVKTGGGSMFIKASGTELGKMTRRRGWRKVNIENVRRLLDSLLGGKVGPQQIKQGLINTCFDGLPDAGMPSIETFFHSLLGRCVIHLHPMDLLPYLCSKNGQKRLRRVLPANRAFHWIAFRGLGVVTAGQIRNCIARKKLDLAQTNIFFLSNHGVIVSSPSAAGAAKVIHNILTACRKNLPPSKQIKLPAAKKTITQTAATIRSCCEQICGDSKNRKTIPARPLYSPGGIRPAKQWFPGVITPEELAYLGAGFVWLEQPNEKTIRSTIRSHFRKTGVWPKAFFVPQQGLFISDDKSKLPLYQKVIAQYLLIRARTMRLGGLKPLSHSYRIGEGL
jgi:rhamnose utilization protein RhaD (predicted bifunctional aldolase and dehydrogenase)